MVREEVDREGVNRGWKFFLTFKITLTLKIRRLIIWGREDKVWSLPRRRKTRMVRMKLKLFLPYLISLPPKIRRSEIFSLPPTKTRRSKIRRLII